MLRLYRMDRWVPWPSLDIKVLVSFVLQGMVVQSPLCTRLGLHWTQMFGLLRVSCASRVLHFIQCAENNFLLRQKMDAERQLFLRIVKLLIQFAFIAHVCACLYCATARLEVGYDASELTPTSFFPNVEILYGTDRNVLTSYSRAVHWAFVSLSGIGNIDSVPSTTLECWFTLIVHMIGAVFYAIVTGVVINTLEERAAKDSKIGSDVAGLSKYLTTTRMSRSAKERVMKGYMMRNVLTENDAVDAGSRMDSLDHDDEILETLPNYLKTEVGIYARAEMIHRREKLFLHCSNGFLVALSSAMVRTRTLISGDYLMKEGKPFLRDFYVIEKGSLQVQRGNHTIKTLQRGQCIGRSWLLQLETESRGPLDYGENTDWLLPDGVAACSIRAVGRCILMTGLSTLESIVALESQYSVDFQFLRAEVRGYEKNESERKAKAIRGIIKAVRRFKEQKRLSGETQNVTVPTSGDKKTE
ncbi:ion transport protein [Nitzschia inconspicua]|uniref:Ion transport protein n=1 Tax=Nitzschia inconspicua TaxID=303405 RepID=A0A9K3LP57_9STRA|nr:ion transport protein [Nitzschia inconspicua]